MLGMLWPALVVVLSNVFYNICQKSLPERLDAFGALTVTYLVAGVISAVLFVTRVGAANVPAELRHLNWTSFVLGLAIIGLEAGYVFLYRAGWKVSEGSVVCNIALAIALVFVGRLLYGETITPKQLAGIALCSAGLVLITR